MNKELFLLILIFFVATFLRFYHLDSVPVGFYRDEAFLGYNAFSILKTAHDINGHFIPMNLESFLFSPAGYAYFSIPFIASFGLSAFSVRFVSALFGSFTIVIVFFLVKELFQKRTGAIPLALVASLLLGVTPWHINLSRASTENVLVVFFITLGVWIYLLWVRKRNGWLFILSFISFGVTLLVYQAPRAFLPLFLPCLFFFTLPEIKNRKLILSIIVFCFIIIIPVGMILLSPKLSTRIHMLSIFQNPRTQLMIDEKIREDGVYHASSVETRIFDNKIIGYSTFFLENYFKHFSYEFLFTDAGLPDRYRVPGSGLLYLFDLPMLLFGFWFMLKEEKRTGLFFLMWIILAPVGSALTYDDIPNLQRTLLILPSLSIISAYGFIRIWKLKSVFFNIWIIRFFMILVFLYSVAYYLHAYYVHQIVHRPWYREEGFKQLVTEVIPELPIFTHVIITNSQPDPAIFFMFYNAYDPVKIQTLLKYHPTPHYGNLNFDKFIFSQQDCPLMETQVFDTNAGGITNILQGDPGTLYINGGSCPVPKENVEVIHEVKRRDGTVVFRILRYISYNKKI